MADNMADSTIDLGQIKISIERKWYINKWKSELKPQKRIYNISFKYKNIK